VSARISVLKRATPARGVRQQHELAHFGSWRNALAAAGLPPQPRTPRNAAQWTETQMLDALRRWASRHGRPPRGVDFTLAAPDRPCATTVRARFGGWQAALEAAGLT